MKKEIVFASLFIVLFSVVGSLSALQEVCDDVPCPAGCDCKRPSSGSAPCTSGGVICILQTPSGNPLTCPSPAKQLWEDYHWPAECLSNYYSDWCPSTEEEPKGYQVTIYENTSCSQVLSNCYRTCACVPGGEGSGCTPDTTPCNSVGWESASKRVIGPCSN
jgi:hypothetical protein